MLRKLLIVAISGMALGAGIMRAAGTFGTVVKIGAEAADLALDEARGVLYIADFTANRIDVMSLATNTIQTSINIAAQPNSCSLSPDGHWLIVTSYGSNTLPATPTNALTLIDLTNNYAKQTFALANPPLGVAFGIDDKALVVTNTEFIVFDPAIGTTTVLSTIAAAAAQALPAPAANFPPQITGASVAASADYTSIYGLGDNLIFHYDLRQGGLTAGLYSSAPVQGPRAVSVAQDGSYAAMGWTLVDVNLFDYAEFPNPSGILNVGGHAVDSVHGIIYSQVPSSSTSTPVLTLRSPDNLTLLESVYLPENMAGKAVIKNDGSVVYAISDSGVMVLPVGSLNKVPRLQASVPSLLFLGNYCNRNAVQETLTITDPGGNHTPFSISSATPGLTVSPSSGTTPATITVSVDPNAFVSQTGTVQATLTITSQTGVDTPITVSVLINSMQPDQRGTIMNVAPPGTLVDLLADSMRQRYYVLRQDMNEVLVFNSTNNLQTATLRTCTLPKSMAETFDGNTLLVGCDNAHVMSAFNLNTLQAMPYINTLNGYVQSVAISNNAILAVMRDGAGGPPYIASIDLTVRAASTLPSLGVWQNQVLLDTVLMASPNGATILVASADGTTYLYDATVGSFTVSRKQSSALSGAYAASAYGQYVVGNSLLNSSLVPILPLPFEGTSFSSGFVFAGQTGYLTTTSNPATPGVIQQVNLTSGAGIQPTQMVEAPVLAGFIQGLGSAAGCTTVTTSSSYTNTCTTVTGSISTTTTTTCATSTSGGTTTTSCGAPISVSGPVSSGTTGFTHSLVLLSDGSAFINLSTSGLTVLSPNYAASVSTPMINAIVSAADDTSPTAPGGLITIWGTQLSPTNLATSQIPLPTALGGSCLTVNGQAIPLTFVSSNQINAQMPFQAFGDVTVNLYTPGGTSNNFYLVVPPTAPAIFLSATAGPEINLPTVFRADTGLLVTSSNPIHRGDTLTIYLTGMGAVSPMVTNGYPAPLGPAYALALAPPTVEIGGVPLSILYAGLAPEEVGVYQINATVPQSVSEGLSLPLTISQGGFTNSQNVRVIQ
jgi:uncharacterized protein (TIGR03437 family)